MDHHAEQLIQQIKEERWAPEVHPKFTRSLYQLDEFQRLSTISVPRALLAIASQWILMGAAVAVAVATHHWAAIVLAMVVIASRQHALSVLVHDASHYRLLPNKWWNDFIGDLFCAYPLLMSTELYRRTHFDHHRYLNSDRDPDWAYMRSHQDWIFPKTKLGLAKIFSRDLLGLNIGFNLFTGPVPQLWSPGPKLFVRGSLPLSQKITFVLYFAGLITAVTALHAWGWFALLWLIPAFTLLNVIFRIRTTVEHLVLDHSEELKDTRSTVGLNWVERFLFAPLHINYHLEHHMFPSVPCYHLKKLHKLLMQNESYRARASLSRSYLGRAGSIDQITSKAD